MYKNVTFVIGKLNCLSYEFVLGAIPPQTEEALLDSEMSLYTYTTYVKGILGLGV